MSVKKQFVEICHKVYEKGFVSAYDGNISYRVTDDSFLITRSEVCNGEVIEEDIIEINSKGEKLSGSSKITTESKIHLFAYADRKEVNAVVHCHPIYSTAFAIIGDGLTQNIFPEIILTVGKAPLCRYATPSTDELTESMKPYIDYA